jgi:FixJ family two-component response regulator
MTRGGIGTVLVVEDDESMREAIATLLDAADIEFATYASAEALLAAGGVEASVCVISDYQLPTMSGFELLAVLRARGPRPPVIFITAHDSESVRQEAQRLGAAAYLAKPFAGSELLASIRDVVATSARQ